MSDSKSDKPKEPKKPSPEPPRPDPELESPFKATLTPDHELVSTVEEADRPESSSDPVTEPQDELGDAD